MVGQGRRPRRSQQAKQHAARVAGLPLQAQGVAACGELHGRGARILTVKLGRALRRASRIRQDPSQTCGSHTELVPRHQGGVVQGEAILRAGTGRQKIGLVVLLKLQGRHLGLVAKQREAKVGGADRPRRRLNTQAITAAAARHKGSAVVPAIGAADDAGRRVKQRPAQITFAGVGLKKQSVAHLRLHRIQHRLRALKLAHDGHVGLHRHGRVFADQAELVGTQRVTDTIDIELIRAGLQGQEAVTGSADITVVKQRALALPQLPLHLRTVDAVEEELGLIGDDELIAILFARLVNRTLNTCDAGHGVGRQQQPWLQRLDLPLRQQRHR